MKSMHSRRETLRMFGATATLAVVPCSFAEALPMVTISKDPNCSCCTGWADHVRAAGFPVTNVAVTDLKTIKTRLGVPEDLGGCHTAEVGGYVLEGHVPASAIERLLRERPQATGLAVPGMPGRITGHGRHTGDLRGHVVPAERAAKLRPLPGHRPAGLTSSSEQP